MDKEQVTVTDDIPFRYPVPDTLTMIQQHLDVRRAIEEIVLDDIDTAPKKPGLLVCNTGNGEYEIYPQSCRVTECLPRERFQGICPLKIRVEEDYQKIVIERSDLLLGTKVTLYLNPETD